MSIREILAKYNVRPNNFFPPNSNPKKEYLDKLDKVIEEYDGLGYPEGRYIAAYIDSERYKSLKNRWYRQVNRDFGGFCIGMPIPDLWCDILNEFLETVFLRCPEFKIMRINIERGQLKMLMSGITDDIKQEINILEENLWDDKLI